MIKWSWKQKIKRRGNCSCLYNNNNDNISSVNLQWHIYLYLYLSLTDWVPIAELIHIYIRFKWIWHLSFILLLLKFMLNDLWWCVSDSYRLPFIVYFSVLFLLFNQWILSYCLNLDSIFVLGLINRLIRLDHVKMSSDVGVGVSLSSLTIDCISARQNGQCWSCDAHVIQKPL